MGQKQGVAYQTSYPNAPAASLTRLPLAVAVFERDGRCSVTSLDIVVVVSLFCDFSSFTLSSASFSFFTLLLLLLQVFFLFFFSFSAFLSAFLTHSVVVTLKRVQDLTYKHSVFTSACWPACTWKTVFVRENNLIVLLHPWSPDRVSRGTKAS